MSFITNQLKKIPEAEQIKEPTELEIAIKKLEKESYLFIIEKLKKYGGLLDNTKPIQEAFNKSVKKVEAELTEHYTKENDKS